MFHTILGDIGEFDRYGHSIYTFAVVVCNLLLEAIYFQYSYNPLRCILGISWFFPFKT